MKIEKEYRKGISFKIACTKIKYLVINLAKIKMTSTGRTTNH
jgi:hypothetical protein